MRSKRAGILTTIGSMAAWYPMAGCDLYDASKAAMWMIGIGLQSEIAGFGIKHCLIEPGFSRTDLLNPGANMAKTVKQARLDDYAELNATNDKNSEDFHGNQAGDPVKGAEIIFDVLTGTGVANTAGIVKSAQATINQVKEWESIAGMSDFPFKLFSLALLK